MEKSGQSRRKFIATVVSLMAGSLFLGRFLRPKVVSKKELLTVAKGDIPLQGALVFHEARVAVIRDRETIYALDLVCTHLGCTVNVTPTELVCPCHGSIFDIRGNVLKGPADRPLARYGVEVRGENVVVTV